MIQSPRKVTFGRATFQGTQLICISDLYLSTNKYKRHTSATFQGRIQLLYNQQQQETYYPHLDQNDQRHNHHLDHDDHLPEQVASIQAGGAVGGDVERVAAVCQYRITLI